MNLIELPKQSRTDAIASIQQYFAENLPEPLGDRPASLLLDSFLQEIAPIIYQAIHDAQNRIVQRATDLPGELFADEFPYWPNLKSKRRR